MIYHCKDCGYRGKKATQGRCPACGSSKIMSDMAEQDTVKKQPLQLAVLIVLWSVLFVLIYRNLSD